MYSLNLLWILTLNFFVVNSSPSVYKLDEKWVCFTKKTCQECLKISACSWCSTEDKCFTNLVPGFETHCVNDTIAFNDYGFSIAENSECACVKGEVDKKQCHPPGVSSDAQECSGRGTCTCGRCVCDPTPDTENPTKMITGSYCELDNFSCEGPGCNEGPYSLLTPQVQFKTLEEAAPEEQPTE